MKISRSAREFRASSRLSWEADGHLKLDSLNARVIDAALQLKLSPKCHSTQLRKNGHRFATDVSADAPIHFGRHSSRRRVRFEERASKKGI